MQQPPAPCLKFKVSFNLSDYDKKGEFFVYIWRNKQDMVANKLISWRYDGVTTWFYRTNGKINKKIEIHFCAKRMPMQLIVHEFDHAVLCWMSVHNLDIYDPAGCHKNEEVHAYALGRCVENFYKKLHRLRLIEETDPINEGKLIV